MRHPSINETCTVVDLALTSTQCTIRW